MPELTTWIRVRVGQEGPSKNRELEVNLISAGLDRAAPPVLHAWSRSAPFREERKSHVVATVEQLAALVRGRLVGDGTRLDPLGSAGRRGWARATSRSSRASATPSSCGPRPPRRRSSARTSSASRSALKDDLPVIEVDDPITAFVAVRRHLAGEQKPRWIGHSSPGLRRRRRPGSARTWRSIRSSTWATTPRSATGRRSTRAS